MLKIKKYSIVLLLILSLVFIVTSIQLISYALFSRLSINKTQSLVIKSGYTLDKIINEINKINFVGYPSVLKIAIKLFYKDTRLQSGEYIIEPNSSLYSIIKKIHLGKTFTRKITIPPGLTNYQVIQKLLQEEALIGNVPDGIPEGVLFPDTYYFKYNDTRLSLIKRMQAHASKNFHKIWNENSNKHLLPFLSIEEAIILASIVEKESQNYHDMDKIAGVFINRLKKNMKLQADPTVIYAISDKTGILNRKLNTNDIKTPSQFNTYYIKGLPLTPIANPSVQAFFFTINPSNTEYLYFVADNTGKHYFSRTLDEHNKYKMLFKTH